MPIPATSGQYAVLPAGRHAATLDEVYEAFVVNAPFRPRRELIFRALTLYIDLVSPQFSTCRFWINGGFVTHKTWAEPEDADVVVVVPSGEHSKVTQPTFMPLLTLGSNAGDKVHPMGGLIDGFVAAADNPAALMTWDLMWSSVRDEQHNVVTGVSKGYLEVSV
ncbi:MULTISPECIES: DUF6932 family protein [Mycolicibacter]|uniref:DUF6932 family protein n=1 Tax=Mycolicibacter TaxID=1073531 RepID=UPI00122C6ECE|nr:MULTISPECIES: hypothetical protein [Mycolicibacter]KAA1431089.1 hypothetical protein F0402_10580 [Mycolicibacter arupensis]ULP48672.1 hypothetical protein MJO54_06095 [Mycolicibacter virginiensis]